MTHTNDTQHTNDTNDELKNRAAGKKLKMISRVWPASTMREIEKQFAAAGRPVIRTDGGNSRYLIIGGVEVLRAMKGSTGRFLVRYAEQLFITTNPDEAAAASATDMKPSTQQQREAKNQNGAGPVEWVKI